jgi:hypothetical protein
MHTNMAFESFAQCFTATSAIPATPACQVKINGTTVAYFEFSDIRAHLHNVSGQLMSHDSGDFTTKTASAHVEQS